MKERNPAVKLKELVLKSSADKALPACLALISPDDIRRSRALAFILSSWAEALSIPEFKKPRSFSFSESIRGSAILPLRQFISSVTAPSLFEPHCIGIVKNIQYAKAADLEPLSAYIAAPPKGSTILITGGSFPNVPTFKKAVLAAGIDIQFEELKGAELARWIERECHQAGIVSAPDEVIETLLSISDGNPDSIAQLVEKLSLFLENGTPPTKKVLLSMVPERIAVNDFEVAEVILSQSRTRVESFFHHLQTQGSNSFMTLGLISKTWLSLLQISQLKSRRLSSKEVRESIGITPWLYGKYAALADRKTLHSFRENIKDLLKADFRLKDRSCGPAAVMSSLLATLSTQSPSSHREDRK